MHHFDEDQDPNPEMGLPSPDSVYGTTEARARYEAYSRLQATAVAFGERLTIPEIVVLGGQSDGKSSLLEALLGFRFNIREVEMGTRRPLMLQMVHDTTATEPRCRLQEEDADEYGPVITPLSSVAEAIRSRTEEHLKTLQRVVSAKPIVMRAEYAFSPNLTVIDTPGFVLKAKKGEPTSTPEDILAMVKSLAAPQNRLLLFLQQSSVEWCSSLWLDTIRSIDPSLHRTIVVVSKFDNRLTEFAERWEVDRYLGAGGYLGENVRPFFVALPKDRGLCSNEEFRSQIVNTDNSVLRHLREKITGGFDEEKFGANVGFANLRKYLEAELQRRYREAAPATLALLDKRCNEVGAELANIDERLAASSDVSSLRRTAMIHTAALARHMGALLNGEADPDPAEWGWTTDEERLASGSGKWPGLANDVLPPNATLKLYGGAAFERVLHEFRCAAWSLECPPVSREKVANFLLAHAGRTGGSAAAAAGIARAAARSWLGPLIDTVCDRLAHVLRNLFELAMERMEMQNASDGIYGERLSTKSGYVAFHAALRRAHEQFIQDLTKECKQLVRHELTAATSAYSPYHCYENQTQSFWEGTNPVMEISDEQENDSEEPENLAPQGYVRPQTSEKMLPKDRDPLKESQLTIPETPSPEQPPSDACAAKRKEFALASGRLAAADAALRKKQCVPMFGKIKESRIPTAKSVYADVCSLVADQFSRIREVLVERTVPAMLNAGFLTPCQDRLALSLGLELFAVDDERFMDMFVAPGMIEELEKEKELLQKRNKMLRSCLQEFRRLARSI